MRYVLTGYILFNPSTGAGAYLIDGGYNGGTDDPGCGEGTATAPATAAVPQPSLRLTDVLALAVSAIIAAPIIIDAAVVLAVSGLMLMASEAAAVPVPGGGTES